MENAMKASVRGRIFMRSRLAIMAILAGGIVTASAVQANSSSNIVVLTPTALPELAKQPGEAMLLRETTDGKAMLYVEQQQGARLAIFDVTDPVHIKGEGAVQLSTDGTFDFVAAIGGKQELIEYRQGHKDAVLDFHKVTLPDLKSVQGLTLRGPITPLGNDGFIAAGGDANSRSPQSYQVIDSTSSPVPNMVLDLKQVDQTISKTDTGTTFFLGKEGLFVIRRPAVESEKRQRYEEWLLQHSGS
jgi:hypothetical protein